MTKKDVAELKSRFKKSSCTFTKISGCYVNGSKEILVRFTDTFLNLEDEEFFKYLEIAKKTLSGTLGNNLLEVPFPDSETETSTGQQFLLGLRESKLKNEELTDTFFQQIIEQYQYVGNYLILIFHDAYDVMVKTSDQNKLDESEEVYEYLLCCICPVSLTKPGLGYLEGEQKIGARYRDWVVQVPETGFLFPAFTDRSSDIQSCLFYTRDILEPHNEIVTEILGCKTRPTGALQKQVFENIIKRAVSDEEQSMELFSEIQESFKEIVDEKKEKEELELSSPEEQLLLTKDSILEILAEKEVEQELVEKIEQLYEETFSDQVPQIEHLLDKKVLQENESKKTTKILMEQIHDLEEKVKEYKDQNDSEEYDVVVKVSAEKVQQISTAMVDGKKCIVIPLEEYEQVRINDQTEFEQMQEG